MKDEVLNVRRVIVHEIKHGSHVCNMVLLLWMDECMYVKAAHTYVHAWSIMCIIYPHTQILHTVLPLLPHLQV